MYTRVYISVLSILSLYSTRGQFPPLCTTITALADETCCPVNQYTGLECGGQSRGQCVYHTDCDISDHCVDCSEADSYGGDDRLFWPSSYFHTWCECAWPFMGSSCDKCVWGYYGSECDTYRLSTRRNALHPDNAHILHDTVMYLDWMKYNTTSQFNVGTCTKRSMMDRLSEGRGLESCFKPVSYYDYIVWIHWYASAEYNSTIDNEFNHYSSGFIPWHRYLMLQWERFLQEISEDPEYTLPYWKWIGDSNCSVCTRDLFGVSDVSGVITDDSLYFSDWTTVCEGHYFIDLGDLCDPERDRFRLTRNPGDGPVSILPTDIKLEWTLTWPDYDRYPYTGNSNNSFRNVLSGVLDPNNGSRFKGDEVDMHLAGHYFMNGSMTPRSTSPNDPVFSIFHTYVDMIYEMWLDIWGAPGLESYPVSDAPYGHCWNDYMVGVFPPQTNSLYLQESSKLNYIYEPYDGQYPLSEN